MNKNSKTSKSNETKKSSQRQRSIVPPPVKEERRRDSFEPIDTDSDRSQTDYALEQPQQRKDARKSGTAAPSTVPPTQPTQPPPTQTQPVVALPLSPNRHQRKADLLDKTRVVMHTLKDKVGGGGRQSSSRPHGKNSNSVDSPQVSSGSMMAKKQRVQQGSTDASDNAKRVVATIKDHPQQPQNPQKYKKEVKKSLIGLDAESDIDTERTASNERMRRPRVISPIESPDKSLSETKESISLIDNEEEREQYKTLFKDFAMQTQKLQLEEFKEEYMSLPVDPTREQCSAFHLPVNGDKNRYNNIPCLEISRVRLHFMSNNQPGSDYIHANYVTSRYLNHKYILTQGPKKCTIVDFWRMVWQEKSTAIVMLCQFSENNRKKCADYFPTNHNMPFRFDKLVLTYEDSTINKSVVTTKLRLEFKGETRLITHLQWTEWPDYQVPGSSETMLRILRKIRGRKTPPVIHCAAGVGRSGTLVAIEIALMSINNHFQLPDIKQIVTNIRLHGRCSAVQTLQQYMLIRKVVLDFGVSNRLIHEESYSRFLISYKRALRNNTFS